MMAGKDGRDPLPLEGIRVVDLGVSVVAPFITQWLAFMGAEVIVLESNKRAYNRTWPPFADAVPGINRAGTFNLLYGSKLSCTLDLSDHRGVELAREIILLSDVLVENLSYGSMDKLGLSYDDLLFSRPDLLILTISAFGRTGPMKSYVGYHSAVLLYSGLAAITGYEGDPPRILGSVYPDPLSGTFGTLALLEALYHRTNTGQGQHIDLAMHESMMNVMPGPIIDFTLNGRDSTRVGNRDQVKVPHNVYPCKEKDTWAAISVGSEEEWQTLCQVAGHSEWSTHPKFKDAASRQANTKELDALIGQWTAQHSAYHIMEELQYWGVSAGPSLDAKGILNDPHLNERGFIIETEHPEVGRRSTVGGPWQISDTPEQNYAQAPLIGQHTEYVLCELLGLSRSELERLTEEKATC